MLKIQKHARGLLISADHGRIDKARLQELEGRIGSDRALYTRAGVVVPTESSEQVLEVFGEQGITWDVDVLQAARERATHRLLQFKARLEVAQALEDPQVYLAGYRRLFKLDSHQIDAVAAMTIPSLKGLALFDEQGSGKTITALAAFDRLHELGQVQRLVVFAPKSVLGAWRDECTSFYEGEYRVAMVDGGASDRRRAILRPHDVLLIGYEAAKSELGLLKTVVAAKPYSYVMAVDESYFVKNAATARAQAVAQIRPYCERAFVLCGTPAPNDAEDIVNQINIADGGIAFAAHAMSEDPDRNQAEIEAGLERAIYLRRLKEEIFPDLPSKNVERVLLDLAPTQRHLYERARDELIVAVKSADEQTFKKHLASFLARRMALLQICSNPGALAAPYTEVPAKLLALDHLLGELVENMGKKVVIWSYFQFSLQAIIARYTHLGVVHVDGSVVRVQDRVEAIRRFQGDPGIRIFVGNAGAAGAGITLTAAHHAIYESFSNQAAHYMQSVDRIHRRGQEHEVTYHVLLGRDTLEEMEFDRLLEKERSGRKLLGDQYEEPMTRERFLAVLGVEP